MNPRFSIIEALAGQGGFGKISKAKDTELERMVAIKTLDPLFKTAPTEKDKERFRREAKTLASLSHPSIPAIYDVQFSDPTGEFRIVFEWIEGHTFSQILRDTGLITLTDAEKWFVAICSALTHAHSRGVIHRDIKPSNIIISSTSGTAYLVDFGIALAKSDLDRLTSGSVIGTPGYMSPEQEKGEELTLLRQGPEG
jgi:serine/threonine-protein kinase